MTNSTFFPATYSVLSATSLQQMVETDYDLGIIMACRLLERGLNDTYVILTPNIRYILRIYRTHWRTLSEIMYELDLIQYLHHAGIPVSIPIRRKDGQFLRTLMAPEGSRQAVLFTYAEGEPLQYPRVEGECHYYGAAIAQMHAALTEFSTPYPRFAIDIPYLVNTPLKSLQGYLTHRQEDIQYLFELADKLKVGFTQMSTSGLERIACHGDLHGGNVHISSEKVLTFFDFDCCGSGWLAYDLAVFRWGIAIDKSDDKYWHAFLDGYASQRALRNNELQVIPFLVAMRHIWLLGLRTSNAADLGLGWMNEQFINENMQFLRDWEAKHPILI